MKRIFKPKMMSNLSDSYTEINDDRDLYLTGEITVESVGDLIKAINDINSDDNYLTKYYAVTNCDYNPAPINIYINSVGGDVMAAMSLITTIENSLTPVHTHCIGEASSAGLLIFITGHKRVGYKSSMFMYHELSSGSIGKLKDLEESVEVWKQMQKNIDEIFTTYTKFTQEELDEIRSYKKDFTFYYKEAIEKGILDQVILSSKYTKDLAELKSSGVVVKTSNTDKLDKLVEQLTDEELIEALKEYINSKENSTIE